VTRPGKMPADESPLLKVLGDKDHADLTGITDPEMRRLMLWLDGNSSFYSAYSKPERLAQKEGKPIPPPALQ